jgi:hypothetical protein
MTTIRIGNDIFVVWKVFSRNGMPFSLENQNIRIWLTSGPFKMEITDFTTSIRGEVAFKIDADSITRYGIYKLELSIYDKDSETEDATFDVNHVFQIVSTNYADTNNPVLDGSVEIEPCSVLNNIVTSTLEGASAYEIAVKHGYTGTEEEWLHDPINGIMGNGIDETIINQSHEQSGISTIKFKYANGAVKQFEVLNGMGISDIDTEESSASSGINTITISLSDGTEKEFQIKNGRGVSSVVKTSSGVGSDADNEITVTYSDGTTDIFTIKNGSQGNSGYSGAAGELEVVNNLNDGGATSALSAEQGKVLDGKIADGDAATKRIIGDVNLIEGEYEVSSFEDYAVLDDGTLDSESGTAADWEHAEIPVTGAAKVRFLGCAYNNPANWQQGYAFYDEDGVCISSSKFGISDDANKSKEYVIDVPAGAVIFKTSIYVGATYTVFPSEETFYCYLLFGSTVKDLSFNPGGYRKRPVSMSDRLWRYTIESTAKYGTGNSYRHWRELVEPGDVIHIKANPKNGITLAFLENLGIASSGADLSLVDGTSLMTIGAGVDRYIVVPAGAICAAFSIGQEVYGWQYMPDIVEVFSPIREEEKENSVAVVHGYETNYFPDSTEVVISSSVSGAGYFFKVKANEKYYLSVVASVWASKTIRLGYISDLPYDGLAISGFEMLSLNSDTLERMINPSNDCYLFLGGSATFIASLTRVSPIKNGVFDGGDSESVELAETIDRTSEWEEVTLSSLEKTKGDISPTTGNYYGDIVSYHHARLPLDGVKYVKITSGSTYPAKLAWLSDNAAAASFGEPSYLTGTFFFSGAGTGKSIILRVPSGANYLFISRGVVGQNKYAPSYVGILKDSANNIFQRNPDDEYEPLMIAASAKHYNYATSEMDTPYPTTLLWLSDPHADIPPCTNFLEWLKRYAGHINDAICSGDQMRVQFYESFDWWGESGMSGVLQVIGNHDAFSKEEYFDAEQFPGLTFEEMVGGMWGTAWSIIKQKYVYDKVFAPFVDSWNVEQPSSAAANGLCFYYKDYTAMRLIVLDCMHYNRADYMIDEMNVQDSWFRSVLLDARQNNLPVVVCSHMSPAADGTQCQPVPCAYNTNQNNAPFTDSDIHMTLGALSAVNDFIDNGGEFVCWLVGHTHRDRLFTVNTGTAREQIVVQLTTGSVRNPSSTAVNHSSGLRVAGTKTDDAFNTISFDTKRKLIKVVRVGANINDMMESYNSVVYRYDDCTDEWGNPLQKGLVSCK